MKATGIVRRIDDLGRVVIPKEIRRTMRIREGDPLEIYTTRDSCHLHESGRLLPPISGMFWRFFILCFCVISFSQKLILSGYGRIVPIRFCVCPLLPFRNIFIQMGYFIR